MNYTNAFAEILSEYTDLPVAELVGSISVPQDASMGHLAFPCHTLAKTWKKAPPLIAHELAECINEKKHPAWINEAVATGPYLNIFFNRAVYADVVLLEVLEAGVEFGTRNQGDGKNVIVEYSSPNIAKHFHVGHLGTTIIGKCLDNIYRFLGYNVTSINHLGDWGTQFGKLITAYLKWGSKEEIEKTEIDGLLKLYVRFHEEADKDESLNEQARSWVLKMQDGDKESLEIWQWFIDLSMREFNRIYERLGVQFDLVRGESYYNKVIDRVPVILREKGLLTESEGAQIVDLKEYGMPPCMILRTDGGTLYATRDIAAALDRHETFNFDKCLYVIGNEQSLYFAQWKKVMELAGFEWASELHHVSYGLFLFEEGKVSTRRGHVIKMEDLLEDSVAKTLAIINEKNPDLWNKEAVAEQVGIGALVFNKLYNSRRKDTLFDWKRMLNFDGETGPYVQYAHARACSVLRKALSGDSNRDFGDMALAMISGGTFEGDCLVEDEAFEVLRLLHDFPNRVEDAAEKYEPYIISRHLVSIAHAFNAFYHNHIILIEDEPTRRARLVLTAAVRQVLKTGLGLLGIAAPAVM